MEGYVIVLYLIQERAQSVNIHDQITCKSVVDVFVGNEYRQFEIKEDTVANQFTAPPLVAPNYRAILDIDGNTVQYLGK